MAFTHMGESADAYVQSLSEDRDEYEYAQAYLHYLRHGGEFKLPRGHRIPAIMPSQEHRIIKRLRNTGTAQDFAHRAIGGTYGTFRAKHRRFTGDEWVGAPGREWRETHRCRYPHGGSEEASRANCPAWRAVSPTPLATERALKRHWERAGMLRTKDRAARRAGKR